ncbi:MAG: nucleotide exchange factor GrpE [Micrococcales bacterium 73-15]|uniref:nucleotide exchange factor GrpE n=1 Tax=Salana multivorans TaxID=120377 RepID=UPI000962CAE0|nr:nucleotide exchange factor GrpE [Salana multivorans]OJX97294.1 MAG: nucleotide exchange factor GrpE [Micrococcales bacterium 73-15]
MTTDSQHEPGQDEVDGQAGVPSADAAASTAGERREGPAGTAADGTAPSAAADGADAEGDAERVLADVLDLQDQLARAKADAYNIDQRFNAFVKRSRELEAQARETGRADVVEAIVPVLDDIELARRHGELSGPFLSIADKLEQVLETRFGVVRYGATGDEFDPELHEALMHTDDPDATTTTVAMVAQPGYRRGDVVIRPARVGVAGPA